MPNAEAQVDVEISLAWWVRPLLHLVRWPVLALVWLRLLSGERALGMATGIVFRGVQLKEKHSASR